jgi:hypothetical protein
MGGGAALLFSPLEKGDKFLNLGVTILSNVPTLFFFKNLFDTKQSPKFQSLTLIFPSWLNDISVQKTTFETKRFFAFLHKFVCLFRKN